MGALRSFKDAPHTKRINKGADGMVRLEGVHDWAINAGERIYAVGDVHGCSELLATLFERIGEDGAGRAPAQTKIVVLGDIVDRGPDTAGVVRRLMRYDQSRQFIVLKGNHEQLMCAALAGDADALRSWLRVGGAEALESYAVPADLIAQGSAAELSRVGRRRVGRSTMAWLDHLPLWHRSGDVLFVHAGIRPEVPLSKQDPNDMMWIREDFIPYESPHPVMVVHGHTVSEAGPDIRPNRIGIDTGAYTTGRLTALGMEGNAWWTLST